MTDPAPLRRLIEERDAGLGRLRSTTRIVAIGTTALAAGLALFVGRTAAGRKASGTGAHVRHVALRPSRPARRAPVPPPPALPPIGSTAPPTSSAPSAAPTPTQQAPVVVSGGS